jgi:hypothetical protein
MRKLTAAVLTTALILIFASSFVLFTSPAFARETCSCGSPDGSCSVSVTCGKGCTQFCGDGGNCYAFCSGYYGFLGMETTFQRQNARYPDLVADLSRISGTDIAFYPTKPDIVFNVGFKKARFWDALELLSLQGEVDIAGQNFERLKKLRKNLLSDVRTSLCVKNTPVQIFVTDLANLTGQQLRITAGNPMAIVNIRLQDATLDDILFSVSEQTGAKIIKDDDDAFSIQ